MVDTLQKQVSGALSRGEVQKALQSYEDLFSVTFRENKALLENICLKIFEKGLSTQDLSLKLESLSQISEVVNLELGRLLVKALYDPEKKVRDRAVDILAEFNNDVLYPEISSCLKSDNLNAIVAALEVIERIGEPGFQEQVSRLLDHEDLFVKAKAVEVIARLKPEDEVVEKLNDLLTHSSDRIRSAVVEAFSDLAHDKADIRDVLKDHSKRVQLALLEWAEKNPGDTADRIVRSNLQAKDMELYSAACAAALQSENLIGRVNWERLSKSSSARLRGIAQKALFKEGWLFDDEAIMKRFFNDPEESVRNFMAEKLIQGDDMFTETLIEQVLDQGSHRARQALIHAWVIHPDIPVPSGAVEELISSDHSLIQSRATGLLDRLTGPSRIEYAEKLLASNKVNVREALFRTLADESNRDLYRACYQRGIDDRAVSVKIAALSGAGALDEADRAALLDSLFESPFWALRRECLVQAKHFSSPEMIWEWAERGTEDPHPRVRKAALVLASDQEDKNRVLELFSDFLFDDDKEVRSYALSVLESPGSVSPEEAPEEPEEPPAPRPETVSPEEALPGERPAPRKKPQKTSKLMDWLKAGQGKEDLSAISLEREEDETRRLDVDEPGSAKPRKEIEQKLNRLLTSGDSEVADQAEDLLLQLGDEKALSKIKNRLFEGSLEERKKAAQKLGFLSDVNLIPVLREQLKQEDNLKVQFELAFAIYRMLPNLSG
jgi:HEAT repeat protein